MTGFTMYKIFHSIALCLLLHVHIFVCDLNVRLNVTESGEYGIEVENGVYTQWLRSAPTFFRADNTTHSLDSNSLQIISYETLFKQFDEFGIYNASKYTMTVGDYVIEAWIRNYGTFFTFDQVYMNDTHGTKADNCAPAPWPQVPGFETCYNYTISAFPSFVVEQAPGSPQLGYWTLADKMIGDVAKQFGKWNANSPKLPDGMIGGPLALFDAQGNTILISPLNNFMTSSLWHQGDPGGRVNWGTMGGIDMIPAGFTVRTIVLFESGINKAFERWGSILRFQYSNDQKPVFKGNDIAINKLGYWTANGAYYFYNTDKNADGTNQTYQDTLLSVKASSVLDRIPYQYVQIDSWWYYRSQMNGVKQWSPQPGIFPDGIKFLSTKTGWPIAAHNGYWAVDTNYAKQNNGKYNFIKEYALSLPDDAEFWSFLLQSGKTWGLTLYEQSWLNIQTLETTALQTDLTIGERWLQQMNDAAVRLNISIQYCMALPRHALQSLKLPAVTQARVSEDYQLQGDQWKIGVTTIFADAMGLTPSKDTFWTTTNQSGNPRYPDPTEPYPDIQSLVSTLSMGPVGPGDKIGSTNRDVLMRCCNEDGLILKPSRPAKAIDRQLIKRAIPEASGPDGEVWTTYSEIYDQGRREFNYFGILFAADLQGDFTVYPNMTGFPDVLSNSFVYSYNDIFNFTVFSAAKPLHLSGCTKQDFCLYYFSQIYNMKGTTMSMVGEINKWVPMSNKRVNSINKGDTNLLIDVLGAVGEQITLYFIKDNTIKNVWCDLGAKGRAILNTATESCSNGVTTPNPHNRGNNSNQHVTSVLLITSLLAFLIRV